MLSRLLPQAPPPAPLTALDPAASGEPGAETTELGSKEVFSFPAVGVASWFPVKGTGV